MANLHISEEDVIKWGHLSSDIGGCAVCKSHGEIVKHHVSYTPEKYIYACHKCHWRIHHEDGFHDNLNPLQGKKQDVDLFDTDTDIRIPPPSNATRPYAKDLNERHWPEDPTETCEPGKHDMVKSRCIRRLCAFCGRTKRQLKEADFYHERGYAGEQARFK